MTREPMTAVDRAASEAAKARQDFTLHVSKAEGVYTVSWRGEKMDLPATTFADDAEKLRALAHWMDEVNGRIRASMRHDNRYARPALAREINPENGHGAADGFPGSDFPDG